ncbi:MAG: hypothetical protein CM15mP32_1010 [Flavobacteriaceae bacterium]|nr:MAG: hypothetical protein CM15mP32_1010 [Flavobacteriaceae bacterium]
MTENHHYDKRHWQFVFESLEELNHFFSQYDTKILISSSDILHTLEEIQKQYTIKTIYSHQETGLACTYARDQEVAGFCSSLSIDWKEFTNNGVFRGLSNRKIGVKNGISLCQNPYKNGKQQRIHLCLLQQLMR